MLELLWSLVPVLICPLVMGAMMWLMMRGQTEQGRSEAEAATLRRAPAHTPTLWQRLRAPFAHICLDKRVVGGLALVGVSAWLLAPHLVLSLLPLLVLAACPLSMVVMPRGMARGQCASHPARAAQPATEPVDTPLVPALPVAVPAVAGKGERDQGGLI